MRGKKISKLVPLNYLFKLHNIFKFIFIFSYIAKLKLRIIKYPIPEIMATAPPEDHMLLTCVIVKRQNWLLKTFPPQQNVFHIANTHMNSNGVIVI